jgi:hypothetical protein
MLGVHNSIHRMALRAAAGWECYAARVSGEDSPCNRRSALKVALLPLSKQAV